MEKKNIFLILIDGMRVDTGEDERDRPKEFDDFARDAIHFKRTCTTATSTLMSVTSILTGQFAVELFPDFKYVNKYADKHKTYVDVLKKEGYAINATIKSEAGGRLAFRNILNTRHTGGVDLKGEDAIYDDYMGLMEQDFDLVGPNLTFIYLPGRDYTGRLLGKILDDLKERGLYDDSVISVFSDHGYLKYGKPRALGWLMRPRNHSNYLDEDTMWVNFALKIPGVTPQVVEHQVCLIDMFETIFDHFGLKFNNSDKSSISLKWLLSPDRVVAPSFAEDRHLRCDTRYLLQPERKVKHVHRYKKCLEPLGRAIEYSDVLIEHAFLESDLSKLRGMRIALFRRFHYILINKLYQLLSNYNDVTVVEANEIDTHARFDIAIDVVDNRFFWGYKSFHNICKQKDIEVRSYNSVFERLEYMPRSMFLEASERRSVKRQKNPVTKFVLLMVSWWINIYETVIRNGKENYAESTFEPGKAQQVE